MSFYVEIGKEILILVALITYSMFVIYVNFTFVHNWLSFWEKGGGLAPVCNILLRPQIFCYTLQNTIFII
jgi:hypothetical protein